jgi:hypothetical protein
LARATRNDRGFVAQTLEKLFDLVSAVNGGTIPDENNLAGNLAQENPQEADDRFGIIGGGSYLHEEFPIQADSTDR